MDKKDYFKEFITAFQCSCLSKNITNIMNSSGDTTNYNYSSSNNLNIYNNSIFEKYSYISTEKSLFEPPYIGTWQVN